MPVWRLQTQIGADSALPRDFLTLTPHFNDVGVGTDPQDLCEDLAEGLASTWTAREIRVTAYDAQGTIPVFPVGEAVQNEGQAPVSQVPRELAICLSFYSERNLPRQRGRLYIPALLYPAHTPANRPTTAHRQAIIDHLVPLFTGLGGLDVDWCVYSRADDEARSVTHYWMDDEWDTVRSRGLRGSERITGTTSEGGP